MKVVRILIVDDHEVVRSGLRALLETQPGWKVVGEAQSGREAVQQVQKLQPEVVVLDIGMPDLNGLDATRQIKAAAPETEILIFTAHDKEELVHNVFEAGARGYLLKSDAGRSLVAAVTALIEHRPFFSPRISEMVLEGYIHSEAAAGGEAKNSHGRLTGRQREIVQLLAEGKSNKEVAAILGVSVKTAEAHRAAIMHKLGSVR